MRVSKENNTIYVDFGELLPGTCFLRSGEYLVKLEKSQWQYNAMRPSNGSLLVIEEKHAVTPLYDATLYPHGYPQMKGPQ